MSKLSMRVVEVLVLLLTIVSSYAEQTGPLLKKGLADIGDIDAADVVSQTHRIQEAQAVRVDGATIYPPTKPIHPLAEFKQKEPPTPPKLPAIRLECEISNPSVAIPARPKINNEIQFREAIKQLKEAHEPLDIAKLRVLFDGVIDIENGEENGKIIRKIRVLSMRGTDFDPEFKSMTLEGTKLIVAQT